MPKSMIAVRLDKRRLLEIERKTPGRADQIVGKVTNDMAGDVENSFSRQSPSAPGGPPGVDTGYLKSQISAEKLHEMMWACIAATDYAALQEFGTVDMAARPFMGPAAVRAFERLPDAFKGLLD